MGVETGISWTTHSWSPWHGCAKVSPGCASCYAEVQSHRNPGVLGVWGVNGTRIISKSWDKPVTWDRAAEKSGERRRVFPSICDPFEDREDLDAARSRMLELIHSTPSLDWLLLTKRPECWRPTLERLASIGVSDGDCLAEQWLAGAAMPNVWLGVSVENQEYADERVPALLDIPAVIRWISYEPALGPVDWSEWLFCDRCRKDDHCGPGAYETPLENAVGGPWFRECHCSEIGWIVVGGESGDGRRPFDVDWAVSTATQCRRAKVPFFMKQDAGAKSGLQGRIPDALWNTKQFPGDRLPKP